MTQIEIQTVNVLLNDDTQLENGQRWEDIKTDALATDYKLTSDFTDLSADDQTLVCALIDMENSKEVITITETVTVTETVVNNVIVPISIDVDRTEENLIDLGLTTLVNGTPWSEYKATALVSNFKDTSTFAALSEDD